MREELCASQVQRARLSCAGAESRMRNPHITVSGVQKLSQQKPFWEVLKNDEIRNKFVSKVKESLKSVPKRIRSEDQKSENAPKMEIDKASEISWTRLSSAFRVSASSLPKKTSNAKEIRIDAETDLSGFDMKSLLKIVGNKTMFALDVGTRRLAARARVPNRSYQDGRPPRCIV